jgi:hypothetical protein
MKHKNNAGEVWRIIKDTVAYKEKETVVYSIVFRDMVWKLSKLQSGYNELGFYVEPYLTPCTFFVLGLLIFK